MEKIKSVLISVFNKEGIDNLCKKLHQNNIEIISTGGTKEHIEKLNIPVTSVESLTDYPPILGGRVKTLHPKVFGAIFNPLDFLYNLFGKKPKQFRKLKLMKEDFRIRELLSSKFDRETLVELLQVEKIDLDEILRNCSYSESFILSANDLQILEAISQCYDEYKLLKRK